MTTKLSSTAARIVLSLLLIAGSVSLSGCASMKDMFSMFSFGSGEDVPEQEIYEPADELAKTGMEAYNTGNYSEAMQAFDEILNRYPFSPQAMLAELKSADCHYHKQDYLEAKTLYKEFEERHPTNEAIPYVMFQIGMCDFSRIGRIDRDISGAQESIQDFSRLLRAAPTSPYASEAKARIRAANEFLVNHEYFVAVFYVRTKKYEQAQHRLKYILAIYPEASIIPKAKALLAKLDAGEPPRWGLSRWMPEMSMPNWTLFGGDDEEETLPKPTPENVAE